MLKQVRKYFIDDDAQLEVMKVRFFFYFYILLEINLLYFKTYPYFDPIGFGCLTREQRECKVYITKLEEQHRIPDRDAPVPVPDWVTGYQSDRSPSPTGSPLLQNT